MCFNICYNISYISRQFRFCMRAMPIPVNAVDLIRGVRVEGPRLEYKRGWNPERVLHTICAFANDIDGLGGGYIIIGVDYQSGIPDIVGIEKSSVDLISKELLNMSNLMEPRYIPSADAYEVEGRTIYIIWVPAGDRRPYSCPSRYSRNDHSGEREYYIRKLSSTIRADQEDKRKLFEVSRHNPFDECINYDAKIDDLRPALIRDYLYRVGSDLHKISLNQDIDTLSYEMRIATGPPEDRRPLNVGIMFFNERPDRFFRGAYVEVVRKPDPTGDRMTVNRFDGPLDIQILNAEAFLKGAVISEMIRKTDGIRSEKHFNYPPRAIRELLVNAVYHKSYEIGEPVVITVLRDRIEFLNYPGPSAAISEEDIRMNRLTVGAYRNRRTGEYLRELDLAEARFSGIPQIVKSLEMNGSPPLNIDTDPGRNYFRAVLEIHPWFKTQEDDDPSRTLEERIESLIRVKGCMSVREVSEAMGYKGVNRRVSETVASMISDGDLEYLHPDKPRSPKQRICLPGRHDGD